MFSFVKNIFKSKTSAIAPLPITTVDLQEEANNTIESYNRKLLLENNLRKEEAEAAASSIPLVRFHVEFKNGQTAVVTQKKEVKEYDCTNSYFASEQLLRKNGIPSDNIDLAKLPRLGRHYSYYVEYNIEECQIWREPFIADDGRTYNSQEIFAIRSELVRQELESK